jgi:hypothetical protein
VRERESGDAFNLEAVSSCLIGVHVFSLIVAPKDFVTWSSTFHLIILTWDSTTIARVRMLSSKKNKIRGSILY